MCDKARTKALMVKLSGCVHGEKDWIPLRLALKCRRFWAMSLLCFCSRRKLRIDCKFLFIFSLKELSCVQHTLQVFLLSQVQHRALEEGPQTLIPAAQGARSRYRFFFWQFILGMVLAVPDAYFLCPPRYMVMIDYRTTVYVVSCTVCA